MILRPKLPLSFRPRPCLAGAVPAGFPSPAADDAESGLDLNAHLIRRPAATFFVRVAGDSMTGAGVHDGDLAIVDRSIEPRPGHVVVAVLDGELALKRLARRGGRTFLDSAHPAYPPIEIGDGAELRVWGVAVWTIHRLAPE